MACRPTKRCRAADARRWRDTFGAADNLKHQSVALIKYPGKIVIHGSSISDVGLGLANNDNAKVFNCAEIDVNILEELKSILNEEEVVIKHPTDWKEQTSRYLKALGFSSNSQYMKNARMISIVRRANDIVVPPMSNNGAG